MASVLERDQSNFEKSDSTLSCTPLDDALTITVKTEQDEERIGTEEEDRFPEGGLRAWSVVVGAWLLQFCTLGYVNAYGVFNDYYVREYLNEKYTTSQIGWIGSTQLFLFLSLGLLAGRATDVGYYRHLMIGGCTLFIFCLLMLSLSRAGEFYQVFLAQGLGVGVATGVTYVPGCAIVSHYFSRRRALALGIMSSGSAIGGAVHPVILNNLFHGSVGFHNGVRISTGFLGVLLLVANLLLKPRLRPKSRHDGNTWQEMKVFMHDAPYVLTSIGTPFITAGIFFPIIFLQLMAIERGINPSIAFYTLVILNLASAFGRVLPTFLVAKLGIYNVMVPCVFVCSGLTFCVLALHTVDSIITLAILYGFFTGAYVGLFAPMIASLARKDTEIGARLGICLGFSGFGGLAGTPVIGALLSRHFIWWRPTVFSTICIFIGVMCFSVSRFIIASRRGTWRV